MATEGKKISELEEKYLTSIDDYVVVSDGEQNKKVRNVLTGLVASADLIENYEDFPKVFNDPRLFWHQGNHCFLQKENTTVSGDDGFREYHTIFCKYDPFLSAIFEDTYTKYYPQGTTNPTNLTFGIVGWSSLLQHVTDYWTRYIDFGGSTEDYSRGGVFKFVVRHDNWTGPSGSSNVFRSDVLKLTLYPETPTTPAKWSKTFQYEGKTDDDVMLGGGGTTPLSSLQKKITVESSTETTKEISPNKLYTFGEVTALNITLAAGEDGAYNEYMFEFNSGDTATVLTLPETVKWLNGSMPTIEPNKTYQVSILNNLAVMGGF